MKIADIEVKLIHHVGSDLDVVNAARVSFNKESEWEFDYLLDRDNLSTKDAKLIHYLAKHNHHSPFNHSFLSFRVKAPLFIARQLQKHKFMPWNEVSRRYVDDEPEFYVPDIWRKRSENVKQGSSNEAAGVSFVKTPDGMISGADIQSLNLQLYQSLLEDGVCPEQARMVLPQNTMTEWRWSGTLGAFLDMLVLRLDLHTQKETRIVAELIAKEVKELFPVSYAAYLGE